MSNRGKSGAGKPRADDTAAAKSLPKGAGAKPEDAAERVPEIGGREGPEPTRYGDWEMGGRCVDF